MDADGNVLMDLFNQIGSLPLGYNHPAIKEAIASEAHLASLITRPSLAMFPPISWPELVQSALMAVCRLPPSLPFFLPPFSPSAAGPSWSDGCHPDDVWYMFQ